LRAILAVNAVARCETSNKFKVSLAAEYRELSHVFGANLVILMMAKISTFTFSLMASYRDLLIISIAIALTARFRQVNKILLDHKGAFMLPKFYDDHRVFHRKLVSLTGEVDKAISSLMMILLLDNLFFICTAFINGLK
jgi:hypothetical protein